MSLAVWSRTAATTAVLTVAGSGEQEILVQRHELSAPVGAFFVSLEVGEQEKIPRHK
jgi:hypothetical protein